MRVLLLIWMAITAWTGASPQADGPQWQVEGGMDLFTTDELGNLYVLRGNDLELHDRRGKRIARNSLNTFGPITGIDAFYSLKPMIFSAPQGQLAVLDNTLSLQSGPTDLVRQGFPQVTLACSSVQNRFWFFDDRELAIKRVDARLNEVANTGRLDQLLNYTPQPTCMVETDGRLYVVDPAHGVMVFDLFGTFVRTLPVTGVERMQVRDDGLWFVDNGKLLRYDIRTFVTEEIPWPTGFDGTPVLDARIEQGRLYLLTAERLLVAPLGP